MSTGGDNNGNLPSDGNGSNEDKKEDQKSNPEPYAQDYAEKRALKKNKAPSKPGAYASSDAEAGGGSSSPQPYAQDYAEKRALKGANVPSKPGVYAVPVAGKTEEVAANARPTPEPYAKDYAEKRALKNTSDAASKPGAYAASASDKNAARINAKHQAAGSGQPSNASSDSAIKQRVGTSGATRPGAYHVKDVPKGGKASGGQSASNAAAATATLDDRITAKINSDGSQPSAPSTPPVIPGAQASAASLDDRIRAKISADSSSKPVLQPGAASSKSLDERIAAKTAAANSATKTPGATPASSDDRIRSKMLSSGSSSNSAQKPGVTSVSTVDERIRAKVSTRTLDSSQPISPVAAAAMPGATPVSLDDRIAAKTSAMNTASNVPATPTVTVVNNAMTPGATSVTALDERIKAKTSLVSQPSQPIVKPEPSPTYDDRVRSKMSAMRLEDAEEPVVHSKRDSLTEPIEEGEQFKDHGVEMMASYEVVKHDSDKLGEAPLAPSAVVPFGDEEVLPTSHGIDAEAQKKGQPSFFQRNKKMCLLVALLVIIGAAVGIGVGVSSGGGSSSGQEETKDTETTTTTTTTTTEAPPAVDPTLCYEAHGGYVPTDRFKMAREYIGDSGVVPVVEDLDAKDTPQRKALCWVSDVDALKLTDEPLIQRFIVAVIGFSMVPEGSKLSSEGGWFNPSTTECDWEGLGCDSDSKLISFASSDEGFEGSMPGEIGGLSSLNTLSFKFETIGGEIPVEIGNLGALTKLEFVNIGLEGAMPGSLGDLTNLEQLTIQQNRKLTGEIPMELANLKSLVLVDLTGNNLSGSLKVIGGWTSLETLTLSLNPFNEVIPPEVGNMVSLKKMTIESGKLQGQMPDELGDLLNLEELHLKSNDLVGTIPDTFRNLSKLVKLVLNNNDLSPSLPDPSVWEGMTSLQELDILQNEIKGTIENDNALCTRRVTIYTDCVNFGPGAEVTCNCGAANNCNCERIE